MASVDDDESLADYRQRRRREERYVRDAAGGLLETFAMRLYDTMPLVPSVESSRGAGRPSVKTPAARISQIYWEMAGEEDELDPWKPIRPPTQKEVCDRLSALGEPISPNTLRKILRGAAMPWPPPRLPDGDVIDEL
jgi:hypothetical protein